MGKLSPKFVTEEGMGYDITSSGLQARMSDGRVAVFFGHENLMRVSIECINNLMGNHGAAMINAGGVVKIWSNDYQVYAFRFTELLPAVFRLGDVLSTIENFPVPLNDRQDCEALIGRQVFWRDFPASITDFDGERGLVGLNAETPDGLFVAEVWSEDEPRHFPRIKEDLLSSKIHWFREEAE